MLCFYFAAGRHLGYCFQEAGLASGLNEMNDTEAAVADIGPVPVFVSEENPTSLALFPYRTRGER